MMKRWRKQFQPGVEADPKAEAEAIVFIGTRSGSGIELPTIASASKGIRIQDDENTNCFSSILKYTKIANFMSQQIDNFSSVIVFSFDRQSRTIEKTRFTVMIETIISKAEKRSTQDLRQACMLSSTKYSK